MRTFDWVSRHDERSRNYPVSAAVGKPQKIYRQWAAGSVLDQGREGACVGFAWTGELLATPKPCHADSQTGNVYAQDIYKRAQQIDEWEGEEYSGTSVLAGAKVLKERGHMDEYRWCFSLDDVRNAVLEEGPVVIGVPWYDGMYETRPSGLVEVSGRKVGGHAILLTGYHVGMRIAGEGWHGRHEVYRWKNSWGAGYGKNGWGLIKADDLGRLLDDRGEACVPMNRKRVKLNG